MKYTEDVILGMDKETFVHTFKGRVCNITLLSDEAIQGTISQIGLSAVSDTQTKEYLPVDIRVNERIIRISQIKKIEIFQNNGN